MPKMQQPDAHALKHSETLKSHILSCIKGSRGFLPFADYMQKALYEPQLGYYNTGTHKLGSGGDFITAPLLSPLFSYCLARQCAQLFPAIKESCLLELGAGNGQMAYDILDYFASKKIPIHYSILEISPDLRERQQHKLEQFQNVTWLDTLPSDFQGVMIANEVIDALPITCFEWKNNTVFTRGVGSLDGEFIWKSQKSDESITQLVSESSPPIENYQSEIQPLLFPWLSGLSRSLKKGALICIDYGFENDTYFHPERREGTLMCHYGHTAHHDPFLFPGLQDITAHVNFSHVARAGIKANLDLIGYTDQASFLLANGLLDMADTPMDEKQRLIQNQAIKRLTLPHEMGELFKVIGFSRGLKHWHGMDLSRRTLYLNYKLAYFIGKI